MSKPYVYEFLWRGGPTSSPDDDTWHVILEQEMTGPDERVTAVRSTALTPVEAEARGFPLSKIVSDLNEAAVHQAGRVRDAEHQQTMAEHNFNILQNRMNKMSKDHLAYMGAMKEKYDEQVASLESRLAASNMEKDTRVGELEKSVIEMRRQRDTAENLRRAHAADAEQSREAVVKWRTEAEASREMSDKELDKAREASLKVATDAERRVADVEQAAAVRVELAEAVAANAQRSIDAAKAETARVAQEYEDRIKIMADEAATLSGLTGANRERYLARILSEPTGS